MKTIAFKNNWLTGAALLLTLPTAYFILIGVLSEFSINGTLESAKPIAEKLGIKDPPGGLVLVPSSSLGQCLLFWLPFSGF